MDAIDDLDKLTTFLIEHDTESSDSESVSLNEIIEASVKVHEQVEESVKVDEKIQVDDVSGNEDEQIAESPQADVNIGNPPQGDEEIAESVYSSEKLDDSAQGDEKPTAEFYDDDEYTRHIINTCTDPLLKNALIANVKKRRLLETLYEQCETYAKQVGEFCRRNRAERIAQQRNRKLLYRSRLGMPYFKDKRGFPCPVNEDNMKPNDDEYSDYTPKKTWTTGDKQKMAKAVYEEVRVKKLAEIGRQMLALQKQEETAATKSKMMALVRSQTAFSDDEFVEQLAVSWNANSMDPCDKKDDVKVKKEQLVSNMTNARKKGAKSKENRDMLKLQAVEYDLETLESKQLILEAVGSRTDIDWNRISKHILNDRHSENECQAKWRCYMNPQFSKQRWTVEENKQLRVLVNKYDQQDWDAIASDLGTYRSAYQCCVHYESTLNTRHKRKPWTAKEDRLLVSTVACCRSANKRISWAKVAFYFADRTKIQLYNRYRFVADPSLKKGNFSIAEDALLLVLARLHDTDFSQMNVYFPGREINQIRARYNTMTKNNINMLDWTVDEDAKLIEHVAKFGEKHWSKLDLERNQHSCRHRYHVLRRWLDTHPGGKLEDVVRRRKNMRRQRRDRRMCIVDVIVNKVLKRLQQMHDRHERDRFLNIHTVQQYVKRMPDYKHLERKVRTVRPSRKSSIVQRMLKNLFKCTYRHRGRSKLIKPDETAEDSARTIAVILQMFQANLRLPAMEAINDHPKLNAVDKCILRQLIIKQKANTDGDPVDTNLQFVPVAEEESDSESETSTADSSGKCMPAVMPPNPETLVGWRGLLLLYPSLVEHSKRKYTVPTADIDSEMKNLYTRTTVAKARASMNQYLHDASIDEQTRDAITAERLLFRRRFAQLFRWPCMMSELELKDTDSSKVAADKNLPVDAVVDMTATETKQPAKRGRPRKKQHYKVDLMNKAKIMKKQMEEPAQQQNNSNDEENTCDPLGESSKVQAASTRNGEPKAGRPRTAKKQIKTSSASVADLKLVDKRADQVKKIQVYTNRKRKLDSDADSLKANVAKRVTRSSTRNMSL